MEILFWVVFILGAITLLGHAIWVLLAIIFRAVFGESGNKPMDAHLRCGQCGGSLRIGDDFCATCGSYQQKTAAANPLAELAMVVRQLDRLRTLGKIDPSTHLSVRNAIEQEREGLIEAMRYGAVSVPLAGAATTPPIRQPQPVAEPATLHNLTPHPIQPDAGVGAPSELEVPADFVETSVQEEPPPSAPAVETVRIKPSIEPRRSLTEMFETFMEESSIRWGELIGGLLIIGCSLALVISLWSQITAVPLLKFSVFVGVTAGLFGMGFYSAHRWRLPTTSQGALLIAALLVPLNFLAMTAFSQSAGQNSLIIVGGEALALALFLFLVYQAGRVITPGLARLLAAATLGPSFTMLLAKHWQTNYSSLLFLGIAPVLLYWLSTAALLHDLRQGDEKREFEWERVFILFGVTSFASLLPIGLFLAKSSSLANSRDTFAPLSALVGVPAIIIGLTMRQLKTGVSGKGQTTATSLAIIGALLSAGGLVLSWPSAGAVIAVGLINCLVCAAIAWRFQLKPAHAAALGFFAIAYLTGGCVLSGNYSFWSRNGERLTAGLLSYAGGLATLSLFVLYGAGAEIWRRYGRRTEFRLYDVAAVISAFLSLLLLSLHGLARLGDPRHLTLAYAFYALAAFVAAWHRDRIVATWIGLLLSLLAMIQALVYQYGYTLAPHHPIRLSLLGYASLTTIAAVAGRSLGERTQRIFARPSALASLISSVAVAPFLLFGGWMAVGQVSIRLLWLAGIWLTLSLMKRWAILFTAFQAVLTAGIVYLIAAGFDSQALPSHSSWLDPHLLQAEGVSLAALSLGWISLRLFVRRQNLEGNGTQALLFPPWLTVDRFMTVFSWALLAGLSLGGISGGGIQSLASIFPPQITGSDFSARAQGFGSWLLLVALLLVFVVSFWERFSKLTVLAIMTLVGMASLLLAGEGSSSPWFLLRWFLAGGFALVAIPIIFHDRLRQVCERFRWPQLEREASGLASLSRSVSIFLFAAPVLILTVILFITHGRLDLHSHAERIVFLLPLVILSLTLAGHAIRERSSMYAFSAGLILNLAATLGSLLNQDYRLITVIQANGIVAAAYSIAWLEIRRRLQKANNEVAQPSPLLLRIQIISILWISLGLLVMADLRLILIPENHSELAASMGNVWGWLMVLLSAAAWAGMHNWRIQLLRTDTLATALLALISLTVCSFTILTTGWAIYHALMVGIAVSAWFLLAMFWEGAAIFAFLKARRIEERNTIVGWATTLGVIQFGMTFRGMEVKTDLWWTVSSFAALCFLFVGLAIAARHRGFVYLSCLHCNLIASRLFFQHHSWLDELDAFIFINIIVLALSSVIWLKLDLVLLRPKQLQNLSRVPPVHKLAMILSLAVIALVSGIEWLASLSTDSWTAITWLNGGAVISVGILLLVSLWDHETTLPLRGLYIWGLILIVKASGWTLFNRYGLLVLTAMLLSFYALVTAALWHWRGRFLPLARRLFIPYQIYSGKQVQSWLIEGTTLLSIFVGLSSLLTVLNAQSLRLRLMVTTAAFALPAAFALINRQQKSPRLITGSLRLFQLDFLFWSWAWLPPGVEWRVINYLVIAMLFVAAILIIYRLLIVRRVSRENLWRRAMRADLPMLAGLGLFSLTSVLGTELGIYIQSGNTRMTWPVVAAVLVTLFGLCVIGLVYAIWPGEDPFNLDEYKRARYVYAAEGGIVLILMHARITMPWLFGGIFSTYWPLIVMVIAFIGVGASELIRKQGQSEVGILAEPLERTGIFLPLLPVIGFWVLNTEVSYSVLLLLVGLFYGWISVMRRSFKFGLLATVAGNGGLWHYLHDKSGYDFSHHPQLWLIPVALSVLLAARINRQNLTHDQISGVRYGSLITIYVSSTADIFLNGVYESPWLPIVLAILSVCGVLAGLLMRIRSFLFLGTAFLLLSMLTMIWSASVNLNWTWLWYVMGIAFGVFIIYTFAMFERKREEMLRFVTRLKQWQ